MNTNDLIDIFSFLNIAILERSDNGTFRFIETAPAWFNTLFADAVHKNNELITSEVSDFLENFLIDANQLWLSGSTGRIKSGIWIETDSDDMDYALEATALSLNECKILLIEQLDIVYKDKKSVIQKGRDLHLDYLHINRLKDELRKSHRELETIIAERTEELRNSYEMLKLEIYERTKAEEELIISHDKIMKLSRYMESIREKEKKLLAREIHDELGQVLTALKMDVAWLEKRFDKQQIAIHEKTQSMKNLIDSCIKNVHKISTELRPGILDDLGLIAAIEWAAEDFCNKTEIACKLNLHTDHVFLEPDSSIAIYRIFQEILRNIYHHACATKVEIEVETDNDSFVLTVADNGKGITESQINNNNSLGIIGMQERANNCGGTFTIKGFPNKGTTVSLRVPLKKKLSNDKNTDR
ncbi:MAG: hypothetical protein JXB48_10470 [Candidatus Latescibacteria bacterium]|nr:hypothetical protein [Candidatus Latescibacterota bacterium]